jgi:hypothetical protein
LRTGRKWPAGTLRHTTIAARAATAPEHQRALNLRYIEIALPPMEVHVPGTRPKDAMLFLEDL